MFIYSTGCTDTGRVRSSNQDAIIVNKDAGLFILADGMGGYAGGEVAASIAVKVINITLSQKKGKLSEELIIDAINGANSEIRAEAAKIREYKDMGTTLVLFGVKEKTGYIAHLGDSRIYLFRASRLIQLTIDHSLINEMNNRRDSNIIFSSSYYKHVITRAMGTKKTVTPDLKTIELETGDIYLLCSDGLTNMVSDGEIAATLDKEQDDISSACHKLIETANENGGEDNISCIIVKIG